MNYKEFAELSGKRFTSGHRMCAGCPAPIVAKTVVASTKDYVVASNATGCMEVATTIYPDTAWNIPWIHNLFENAAATISGVETAYRALKKKGKIDKEVKFVAFGGDGGTYDIGLQSLSGALERAHDFTYVCYNNEGYMNCLSLDSMIMTKDGLRNITEIEEGDRLYSFDPETQDLVLRECAGVYDNGVKEVFEVKTLHHSLKATGNHPFLVVKYNGGGKRSFEWKIVEKLEVGDKVVVQSKLSEGKSNDPLVENEHFDTEGITEIKSVGLEPTLDLQVRDSHNFIANGYVVHNTGGQRSSATPQGASATTSPAGKVIPGKTQWRKNLMEIAVAHDIPYAAQAAVGNWLDLSKKAEKCLATEGPCVLSVLSPCILFWGIPTESAVSITKAAMDTCFWPIYEVEGGQYKLNYKPTEKKPVTEFIKTQARFKHLLKPEWKGVVDDIQAHIDRDWAKLLRLCGE